MLPSSVLRSILHLAGYWLYMALGKRCAFKKISLAHHTDHYAQRNHNNACLLLISLISIVRWHCNRFLCMFSYSIICSLSPSTIDLFIEPSWLSQWGNLFYQGNSGLIACELWLNKYLHCDMNAFSCKISVKPQKHWNPIECWVELKIFWYRTTKPWKNDKNHINEMHHCSVRLWS